LIMNLLHPQIRFLRYASKQQPTKTAIVCGGHRLTYAQFSDRAARLAGAIKQMGVKPGDRIAFLSGNCHRLLEAYYGVLAAGAVLLPLNIRLAPPELSYILNDSEARVLFFEHQFSPLVDSFRQELRSVETFCLLDSKPGDDCAAKANYEDLLASATSFHPDIIQFD